MGEQRPLYKAGKPQERFQSLANYSVWQRKQRKGTEIISRLFIFVLLLQFSNSGNNETSTNFPNYALPARTQCLAGISESCASGSDTGEVEGATDLAMFTLQQASQVNGPQKRGNNRARLAQKFQIPAKKQMRYVNFCVC